MYISRKTFPFTRGDFAIQKQFCPIPMVCAVFCNIEKEIHMSARTNRYSVAMPIFASALLCAIYIFVIEIFYNNSNLLNQKKLTINQDYMSEKGIILAKSSCSKRSYLRPRLLLRCKVLLGTLLVPLSLPILRANTPLH